LAGTNAGADYDPAPGENPTAQMRLDRTARPVEARFIEGSEHEAAWPRFLEANEAYRGYAQLLHRPIPLVQLIPAR